MDEVVRYEVEGGVATVTLDRPEHLNTMSGELLEQALAPRSSGPTRPSGSAWSSGCCRTTS